MTLPPSDAYRRGVGMLLLDPRNRVFVGRRIDQSQEAWQMPQGGIDPGETPRQTALRELKEEIGTDRAEFLAESAGWFTYDLPDDLRRKVWRGQYRGQRQKWFAMRFVGGDDDIDLGTHHPEFNAWRWIPPDQLETLIVPFKRQLYREVLREFAPLWQDS